MNPSTKPGPLAIKWWPGIPHHPTLLQHRALLEDFTPEILYGGAAGGGKSDWLLTAALQYVDVPGYAALLLRRTFPQLKQSDGLLPRAQEWLNGKAQGVDSIGGLPTKWIFPSGATLEFGHMQHDKDRYSYQGGAYQFIGFDEAGQFLPSQYLYLFSRARRPKENTRAIGRVPIRIRGASNPGGPAHDFLKQRFGIVPGERTVRREGRLFIKATLDDNPHLDSDEYKQSLAQLHPYERAQLLDGDWDARPPGSRFRREWFQILDAPPMGLAWERFYDLAATEAKPGTDPDYTATGKMARTPDGRVVIWPDQAPFRGTPGQVDARMLLNAKVEGPEVPIWIEQEPGSSGKIAIAHFVKLLAGFTVRGQTVTGDKVVRANPLAAYAEAGNVDLVRTPHLEAWLTEVEHFPNGSHDDQVDWASLGFSKLCLGSWSFDDLYRAQDAAEEARS